MKITCTDETNRALNTLEAYRMWMHGLSSHIDSSPRCNKGGSGFKKKGWGGEGECPMTSCSVDTSQYEGYTHFTYMYMSHYVTRILRAAFC